jgi:SagB-type dehydrogenase family enzyme
MHDPWQIAAQYHEATKHHFDRYARSLGYLDWATQPDPFRRFSGAELTLLPLHQADRSPPYEALFGGQIAPRPVSLETVGWLFEHALAITAWKSHRGSSWALRANPSSGNLHPTEGYALLPAVEGLPGGAGVFHYAPKEHALERRCQVSPQAWRELARSLPPGGFLVGLSSIYWREAWKYGERAYRYCQHDTGHALAALRLAAAALGWKLRLLESIGDDEIGSLLGLDRPADFAGAEREEPELLAAVWPSAAGPAEEASAGIEIPAESIAEIARAAWQGRANRLSPDHVDWPIIDRVASACRKPRTPPAARYESPPAVRAPIQRVEVRTASQIFRQRRSAVALDGTTSISRQTFYTLLARVVPSAAPPWDAWPWPPLLHLALFVHRVDGVPPGLYALARSGEAVERLRAALDPKFDWVRPEGTPAGLQLFHLRTGDARHAAARVSCHQEIAGDGALSLGMLADWEEATARHPAWRYPRLFWESGLIGQVLYLEAEAAGVRGTGIGCFFDDPVHRLFGLTGTRFQSLYHFALGGPVDDPRITTCPAYGQDRGQSAGPKV